MKKIKYLIVTIALSMLCVQSAFAEDAFYSNAWGLTLSEQEYNYITQFVSENSLDMFSPEEYAYFSEYGKDKGVVSETKYVETKIVLGNVILNEEYISEEEYIKKKADEDKSNIPSLISTFADKRKDYVETNMKKITLELTEVGPEIKKVRLTCEWKDVPNVKSYDLLGFRTTSSFSSYDINSTDNIIGLQEYDTRTKKGNTITYLSNSENIKSCKRGIGISMNIADDAYDNLKLSFSVNFITKEENVCFAGSYQHAIKSLKLWQSKKYDIMGAGMGNVFVFSGFFVDYASYYDNTPGLEVIGAAGGGYV